MTARWSGSCSTAASATAWPSAPRTTCTRRQNLHVYLRLEARRRSPSTRSPCRLCKLEAAVAARPSGRAPPRSRPPPGRSLGVVVKKAPWHARWNDVGAYGHRVLASTRLDTGDPRAVRLGRAPPSRSRPARPSRPRSSCAPAGRRRGAGARGGLRDATEARYVPEGEYAHAQVWEAEDVWLGPPIFDGCPQRPYDQLIPASSASTCSAASASPGTTRTSRCGASPARTATASRGVKKAYALVARRTSTAGGTRASSSTTCRPTTTTCTTRTSAGLFLLEAYDVTGSRRSSPPPALPALLGDAAPPANGHTEEAPASGSTAGAGTSTNSGTPTSGACSTPTLGLHVPGAARRTYGGRGRAVPRARDRRLPLGNRAGRPTRNGQLLYCLSQADPPRAAGRSAVHQARPGAANRGRLHHGNDYRLLVANRVQRDPALRQPPPCPRLLVERLRAGTSTPTAPTRHRLRPRRR